MKLLTKEILSKLPALYATEHIPTEDQIVVAKFFNPYGSGTWLVTEYSKEKRIFFCYAHIQESEWGYTSLDELESLTFMGRPKIERDRWFTPRKFSECVDSEGRITV